MCDGLLMEEVSLLPLAGSPKLQLHNAILPPAIVDELMKLTGTPAHFGLGIVNDTIGIADNETVLSMVVEQPALDATSFTLKSPLVVN